MAGRGRGRKMITFNMETVGVPRGDSVPVMEQKPLPLLAGEELDYLLALKQELRGAMKTLPCFIQPASTHRDVERYSDKYHSGEHTDTSTHWITDRKRLPKELRTSLKRRRRDATRAPSPQRKKRKPLKEEVLLKLETLEKKEEERGNSGGEEQEEEEETEEKKKQENEDAEGEEEYDEEEFEEETDYIMSYFDNGEEFGGDSDDNMDEAVY